MRPTIYIKTLLLIITVTISTPTFCHAFTSGKWPADKKTYREGELIVKFKNEAYAGKSLTATKAASIKKLLHIKAHHIRLPAGTSVAKAVEEYSNDPNVIYAEPNYLVRKSATIPNDNYFSQQWGLSRISAPTAWDSYSWPTPSSSSVIVAVLDTGTAYNHPDLQANLWTNPNRTSSDPDYYGANFGGTTTNPWDDDVCDSHGTHLSGIIGAIGNNSIGISGINWAARIMALKVLQCTNQCPDNCSGDIANITTAVHFAIDNGAKIINMSFELDQPSQALAEAIQSADNAGVLVISAAGNSGNNLSITPAYPASVRSGNNIAVAASTYSDNLADYSNYGSQIIHLAAPGGDYNGTYSHLLGYYNAILSTVWLNNTTESLTAETRLYRTMAGTSMAAPHVAGAAALIWNRFPGLSHYQVKDRIIKSVDILPAFADKTISGGRLNLTRALNDLVLSASTTSGTAPLTVAFTATPADQYTTWEWDLGSGSYTPISGVSNSLSHTFQTAGSYLIRVRADGSEATVTIAITSPPPNSSGGGGCFIATAAWGSPLHPKVALLRAFRDRHLLTNQPGRMFVKAYYTISPPVADFIRQREDLRTVTRITLTPLIAMVENPLIAVWSLLLLSGLTVLTMVKKVLYTPK